MGIKTKIVSFFALAEGIAGAWALIPFLILLYQQRSDPTNPKYIVDFAVLFKDFMIGQIPGMFISAIVHLIFGMKKSRYNS